MLPAVAKAQAVANVTEQVLYVANDVMAVTKPVVFAVVAVSIPPMVSEPVADAEATADSPVPGAVAHFSTFVPFAGVRTRAAHAAAMDTIRTK